MIDHRGVRLNPKDGYIQGPYLPDWDRPKSVTNFNDFNLKDSTPSMHRMLYIEEILCEIFSYLLCQPETPSTPPGERSSPRRDVVALVRTCRTFKEPALDILWEYLHNLTPLVRCLPEVSSVNQVGVRSFRHLNKKIMIKLSADLLIQQAAPTSRLGHHPGLYTPRPKTFSPS